MAVDTYLTQMALACADIRRTACAEELALVRTDIATAPHRRHGNANLVAAYMVVSDVVSDLQSIANDMADHHAVGDTRGDDGQLLRRRQLQRGLCQLVAMADSPDFAPALGGAVLAWRVQCEALLRAIAGGAQEGDEILPEQDFFAPLP